ncbi:MAG: plasmid pRiA4b ORF-3 family protein [Dysgonamonadaceae bacterium]|jgi:hypothetical protein|nr:plasmid pRiA4b ORF-3 family protein [Dysgonamonadaceae bacterium]
MVYRFILVSEEVDDFRRDITIDSDATFLELHEAILDSVGYGKDQITSFFICDDDWTKQTEITLIDMDSSSDEDVCVMDTCRLSELLDEERQKLIYIFEPLTERCFYMELRQITPGKSQDKPLIVKSVGQPPKQISFVEDLDFSIPAATTARGFEDDDDLYGEYGDDDYDEEDLEDLSEGNPFEY